MGRVVAGSGEPLPGVVVEIWQADAHGRYHHPEDGRRGPRDPHFQGFGSQRTDAQGRYRFKTIKPGAYPAAPGWIRPPHIHFQVTGNTERLVTQMYFPGEPLNDRDPILQASGAPAALVTTLSPPTPEMASDALIAVWDIVLASG
jgi:protocatechuate 3,4-dioxygenase beta subunit